MPFGFPSERAFSFTGIPTQGHAASGNIVGTTGRTARSIDPRNGVLGTRRAWSSAWRIHGIRAARPTFATDPHFGIADRATYAACRRAKHKQPSTSAEPV